MTAHDTRGRFTPKNCGDIRCTGKHSSRRGDKWSDVCPAYKERRNAQRRIPLEAQKPNRSNAYTCEHPHCTGIHGSSGRRAEWCPAYKAKDLIHQQERRDAKREDPETFENEVQILPGHCIAWTPRHGHCLNPTDALACKEHARDFAPPDPRPVYFRAEDYPEYASMNKEQRERFRKLVYMRVKRNGVAPASGFERATAALNAGTEKIMLRAAQENEKRRAFAMAKLAEDGCVSTADVAKEFHISRDTIARLFTTMVEEGIGERMYGGVKLPGADIDPGACRRGDHPGPKSGS